MATARAGSSPIIATAAGQCRARPLQLRTLRGGTQLLTQQAALDLVAGNDNAERSYQAAAARLGLPAGLVYLIATGVPADSSDGLSPQDLARPGLLPSAQRLFNPPADRPDQADVVRGFLTARARGDAQMQAAGQQDHE